MKPRLDVRVPDRMKSLPRDDRGFIIPWFVEPGPDGVTPDFRVTSVAKAVTAHNQHRCWICGKPLGRWLCFAIGPMCAINRNSAEPPSHRECVDYATQVCPFMLNPRMIRNEKGLPEERGPTAGHMISRNPGVMLMWVTRSYRVHRDDPGILFEVGPPLEIRWVAEGRTATDAEIMDSINSGLPILLQAAKIDGVAGVEHLRKLVAKATPFLPAAPSWPAWIARE